MKPELVLIVGAGASIPCGIPGTREITAVAMKHLPDLVTQPVGFITKSMGNQIAGLPVRSHLGPPLEEGLRGAFGTFDFELLLHALESLEAHAVSAGISNIEHRPVMTAFADVLQRYDVLRHSHVLHVARHQIIEAIHAAISDRCENPIVGASQNSRDARAKQERFIKELSRRFRIIAIDLNYDDLLDRIDIGWDDGFRPSKEHQYEIFDSVAWLDALKSDRHLLIHVHGSVRYGHQNIPDTQAKSVHEPAKYSNPAQATATFAGRGKSEPSVAGRTVTAFPFISGLDKGAKIVHNVRPYGYYHAEIGMALARAKRLAVIGYSGRDEHLQGWISEHTDIHGSDRKALALILRPGVEIGEDTNLLRMLQKLAGKPGMFDRAYAEYEIEAFNEGPLLFYPRGVPGSYANTNSIIRHLTKI